MQLLSRSGSLSGLLLLASACTTQAVETTTGQRAHAPAYVAKLERLVPQLLADEKAAGVGVAVIRDGAVEWTGYYGEQSPGVPASQRTAFNTASVAKTITAETLLALDAKGLIDLDEPVAPFVAHPDLAGDPHYAVLTARMLLSHRAGLLNWAYAYPDGKLAFDHDPDTRFSYSGAGVELAARYAEAKTGKSLQALAAEHVLAPLGMDDVSLGDIPAWADGRMATPMDASGAYRVAAEINPNLAPGGGDRIGASDDLIVTVPAYARLIAKLTSVDGLGDARQKGERETIVTSLASDPVYACPRLDELTCPDQHGHSVGWQVYRYGEHTVLKHSGSDAGENALVYASPDARHGAVIFVNGANGWVIMTRIVEAIGDEPLIADYYRGLIQTVMGRPMPPLSPMIAEQ